MFRRVRWPERMDGQFGPGELEKSKGQKIRLHGSLCSMAKMMRMTKRVCMARSVRMVKIGIKLGWSAMARKTRVDRRVRMARRVK